MSDKRGEDKNNNKLEQEQTAETVNFSIPKIHKKDKCNVCSECNQKSVNGSVLERDFFDLFQVIEK